MHSMFEGFSVRAVFQSSAVVLAIVALSPVPLALPSGIAVAVIGLIGAVSLLTSPVAAPLTPRLSRPPENDRAGIAVRASRLEPSPENAYGNS